MGKSDSILNKLYEDQSSETLVKEKQIFFEYNSKSKLKDIRSISIKNKDIIINDCIYLRGDNLITRKTIYIRIFSRKVYLNTNSKIANDNHIYSFVLMPHIKTRSRCQINSKRATLGEYNDNPFIFYGALKELYKLNFEKKEFDKLEEWIVKDENICFWELFGKGEDGYKNYLKVFCLECIDTIMTQDKYIKYSKFFIKQLIPSVWGKMEWDEYNELLNILMQLRKKEMVIRIDSRDT